MGAELAACTGEVGKQDTVPIGTGHPAHPGQADLARPFHP